VCASLPAAVRPGLSAGHRSGWCPVLISVAAFSPTRLQFPQLDVDLSGLFRYLSVRVTTGCRAPTTGAAQVRRRLLDQRVRRILFWHGLAAVACQLALALFVDQTAIRDPDYRELDRLLRARIAESPGRPLVLVMGSSRTQMGLDAARLNDWTSDRDPLVFNASISGSGPMMRRIELNRLLAAGIRPDFLVLEMMPVSLSARDGVSCEERVLFQDRYSVQEVASLWNCFDEPYRLVLPWARVRFVPYSRQSIEVREVLWNSRTPTRRFGRDDFGWVPYTKNLTPADIERRTAEAIDSYRLALTEPAMSPGAMRAYRNLLQTCADAKIPVLVFCPPEGKVLRDFDPPVAAKHFAAVRDIAAEFGTKFVDAREWCADGDFWDGHHLMPDGARRYTEHFGREMLPRFGRRPTPVLGQTVSRVRP
jgi:hypothetical protein